MYADDVQLYVSRPIRRFNECVSVCQTELEIVSQWAKINGLGLNPKKSKCIVVGKRVMVIEYVKSAINLGLMFNQTLTWDDHVNKSEGKMYAIQNKLREVIQNNKNVFIAAS